MNIAEKISHKLGIRKGGRDSIAKQFPSVSDPSAYMSPLYWGEALRAGREPKTKAEYIDYFKSWVYICASKNASAVASTHGRLLVRKTSKTQKFKTIETIPLAKDYRRFINQQNSLKPFLKGAADVEEVMDHPFIDLISTVNPFYISMHLWELTSLYMDLAGEAFWYIIKDEKYGVPSQIWVIPSQYVTAIPGGEYGDNFIRAWKYTSNGQEVEVPLDQMVRFYYSNPKNQYIGFSTVEGVADSVYIYSQMDIFEKALFENKGKIGGIITMEDQISEVEQERLKMNIQQQFTATTKAGKTLVMPKGMKFTRTTMGPDEMSFIEGRKATQVTICAAFDCPYSLFDPGSNRANADSAEYLHAKDGVKPRLMKIQQTINEHLLPRYYGNKPGDLFWIFDDCVPENRTLIMEERKTNVAIGAMTINEVRAENGDEPIEGGDEPLLDGKLVPLSRILNPPAPPPQPPQLAPPTPTPNEEVEFEEEDEDEKAMSAFVDKVAGKIQGMLE